jgi:hypothetical protein
MRSQCSLLKKKSSFVAMIIMVVVVRSGSNPEQDFLMRELMESIHKFTPASRRPCELGAV